MIKCTICDIELKSVGNYDFRYLLNNYKLCGMCAKSIEDYIIMRQKTKAALKSKDSVKV